MSETKPEQVKGGESGPSVGDGPTSVDDDQIQVSDRAILDLMRSGSAVTVGWLSKRLQVTDTAIRQRLTRLMDRGQVVRSSQREGRGRPKHLYRITDLGVRQCGANLEDLAVALWSEVLNLPNGETRRQIIEGVVARLAEQYMPEIQGTTPAERSQQVVELFNRRNVSFAFDSNKGDGRFSVLGCPYPGLSEHDTQICSMEHALFQRLIGLPLDRISDGCDGCQCRFVPASETTDSADAVVPTAGPLPMPISSPSLLTDPTMKPEGCGHSCHCYPSGSDTNGTGNGASSLNPPNLGQSSSFGGSQSSLEQTPTELPSPFGQGSNPPNQNN